MIDTRIGLTIKLSWRDFRKSFKVLSKITICSIVLAFQPERAGEGQPQTISVA